MGLGMLALQLTCYIFKYYRLLCYPCIQVPSKSVRGFNEFEYDTVIRWDAISMTKQEIHSVVVSAV